MTVQGDENHGGPVFWKVTGPFCLFDCRRCYFCPVAGSVIAHGGDDLR